MVEMAVVGKRWVNRRRKVCRLVPPESILERGTELQGKSEHNVNEENETAHSLAGSCPLTRP